MAVAAGIGDVLETVAGSIFGAGGLLGTVGTAVATSALTGAAIGAGEGLLTGGNIGKDALMGGLTGGLGAGAGAALDATAGSIFGAGGTLGTTGSTIAGDAIGGALAQGLTGGNVLKGVESGAMSGVLASALGGLTQQGSKAPAAGGGGGTAAPAGVGAIDPNVVAPDVVNAPVTGTSMTVGGSPAGLPDGVGVGGVGGGGADTSLLGATGGPQTLGSGVTGSVGNGAASSSSSALSGSGTAGDQFSSAPSPNVGGLTQSNAAASAITGSAPMTTTSSLSDLGVSPLASAPTLGTAAGGPTNLLTQSDNMPIAGFNADGTAIDTSGTAAPGAGGILGTLAKNPMADIAALGMGANLLAGNKTPAYSGQLAGAANTLAAQGNQLTGYLTSGALPPGMQDSINRATSAGAAQIRSMYAARGMTGSSAEQQDLQNLQIQAQAQAAQMAEQLYKQGISDMGMSDSLYQQLMQTFNARDAQTSNAIATFAGSLARMGMPATQQAGGI